MQWARLHSYRLPALALLFAIPNGGRRDAVTGAKLKAEGVKAGVPDLFLPVPSGPFYGLFIEMKIPGNRVSREQAQWLRQLSASGYRAEVCYGWEAAAKVLSNHLEGTQ